MLYRLADGLIEYLDFLLRDFKPFPFQSEEISLKTKGIES